MSLNTSNSGQHLSKEDLREQVRYFRIFGFMERSLGLTGLALIIFAQIFAFWLSGGVLFASNESLAATLNYARESVNRTLRRLVSEKWLIKQPQRGKQGVCFYTINEATLCEKVTGWCDIISHIREMLDHNKECGNITSSCDETSHRYNTLKNKNTIGDSAACPLPAHLVEDKDCSDLWDTIQAFPDWRGRPIGAKAAALQILEGYDVVVCREMLRNTASRVLSKIYPPDPWMLNIASTRCDKKSQQESRPKDKRDDVVISSLASCFPAELKDDIYDSGLPGQRGLRFRDDNGKVVITCSQPVRDWLTAIQSDLEPVLQKWVGPNYAGFEFNIPNL